MVVYWHKMAAMFSNTIAWKRGVGTEWYVEPNTVPDWIRIQYWLLQVGYTPAQKNGDY